jgi:hypothetical protein
MNDVQQPIGFDLQTSLFQTFPLGGQPRVFVPIHEARRQAPLAQFGFVHSPDQEDAFVPHDEHRRRHLGIEKMNPAAVQAHRATGAKHFAKLNRAAASQAEANTIVVGHHLSAVHDLNGKQEEESGAEQDFTPAQDTSPAADLTASRLSGVLA